MFEHCFDANSPFAGLVNCHWTMPLCTGLPPLVRFGKRAVFEEVTHTEPEVKADMTGKFFREFEGFLQGSFSDWGLQGPPMGV